MRCTLRKLARFPVSSCFPARKRPCRFCRVLVRFLPFASWLRPIDSMTQSDRGLKGIGVLGRNAIFLGAVLAIASPVRAGNVIATTHEQVVWQSKASPQDDLEYGEGSIEWGPKAPIPPSATSDASVMWTSFNAPAAATVVVRPHYATSSNWRPRTWTAPSCWRTAAKPAVPGVNSPAPRRLPEVNSIENSK